jgi:hypothetical protein
MKRNLSLVLLMIGLTALASAQETQSSAPGPERILQAQRNQKLVEKLVAGSLNLARANDRLDRAKLCNELAKSLADEIKQAADDHDGDRAVELGRHLQDVLKNGVAGNLTKERSQFPPGSARETDLMRVWDESEQITGLLMTNLEEVMKDNPAALSEVLQAINGARSSFAVSGKQP